jgi:hypothetical protein
MAVRDDVPRGRGLRYAVAAVLTVAVVAPLALVLTAPPDVRWLAGTGPPATVGPAATVPPPTPAPTTEPPAPKPRPTPVRVALFGDSQASALYQTRPRAVDRKLRLTDASISACGIMGGRVSSRSGERFNLDGACPNWLSAWRADAARARAEIALVVIGAWEVFDVTTGQGTLRFGTPEWDEALLTALRAGIGALRESGAQVALAELPCWYPRRTNPRPPGWWPERGEDDRVRHVNRLLRTTADGRHVFTVRTTDAYCSDREIRRDKAKRYDGVHYLQPGAKLWFDAVIPQLLTLPE